MNGLNFRKLKADEIEVRVAQIGDGWAQLLLYKNARVDMSILDETVGAFNWQREHYECKGNLFCKVGIAQECIQNDGTISKEWTWKSDCGAESNTEKEKGEASDSFKRACTNWGIGRELYTAPAIFVNVETISNGGRYILKNKKTRFKVNHIYYDAGKIVELVIADQDNNFVYTKTWSKEERREAREDKDSLMFKKKEMDEAEKEIKYKRIKRV